MCERLGAAAAVKRQSAARDERELALRNVPQVPSSARETHSALRNAEAEQDDKTGRAYQLRINNARKRMDSVSIEHESAWIVYQ